MWGILITKVRSNNIMTLHIFNPEHDLALASNLKNFTSPHAGRQLRHDLAWIPALWAEKGDKVLVDDIEQAINGYHKLLRDINRLNARCISFKRVEPFSQTPTDKSLLFVQKSSNLDKISAISPWGWNQALHFQLEKTSVNTNLLPTEKEIEDIRNLSHRRTSSRLLNSTIKTIDNQQIIGESVELFSEVEISDYLRNHKQVVIKAPWSSSGRGVRFINGEINDSTRGWLNNILHSQGSVMTEPYYQKVKDFAMEFKANNDGTVDYCGLSLFSTTNGAYTGNLLATESQKEEIMNRYLSSELLTTIHQTICNEMTKIIAGKYSGPFGVDMMIINNHSGDSFQKQFYVNPCVEINLRRTMGHVALALTKLVNTLNDSDFSKTMRVTFEDNKYKLKIQNI